MKTKAVCLSLLFLLITAFELTPFPSFAQDGAEQRRRDEAAVRRRAWLVRGSSVLGVNVVPEWLTDGFVSLAASQLRQPPLPFP